MLLSTKLTLLFACIILFVLKSTQAYCVYNYLEWESSEIHVYDENSSSKSFDKVVYSLQQECCHWSNKDCNPHGQRESYVGFHARVKFYRDTAETRQVTIYCQAGGSLVFRGSDWNDVNAVCTHIDVRIMDYPFNKKTSKVNMISSNKKPQKAWHFLNWPKVKVHMFFDDAFI
ncbi:hypothetical protein BD770DRAFT_415942 [Pilaira anomala]|nr:hypothetical protein BD770DRAFT_415942 [Pilaira anomala]